MKKKPWALRPGTPASCAGAARGLARALVCVAVLALVAPGAAAHGAPPPQEAEVRLLHDHNDDCGGDGVTVQCRGTHDLIALDAREAWNESLGNVVVFRFIMDEGQAGTLTERLSFTAAGKEKTFTLRSSGTPSGDFDRVGPKSLIADGDRFAIEATVAFATLGVSVGDSLQDFHVEARRDGTAGDYMPGGFHGPAGTVEDPPEGNDRTSYARPSLRLDGPIQYAELRMQPASATVDVGEELLATVSVQNELRRQAQSFTFSLEADLGVEARFHDPDSTEGGYSSALTIRVPPGGQGAVHLSVVGQDPDTSGTVRVTVTTDKGGRLMEAFAFGVGTAPPATTSQEPPPDEDAPGRLVWPAIGLIMAAVLARRR